MYTYDDLNYCSIPKLAKFHGLEHCIKIITIPLDVDDNNCSINFIPFILFLRKISLLFSVDGAIYIVIKNNIVFENRWLIFKNKLSVSEYKSVYNNIDDMVKSLEQRVDGFDKILIFKSNSSQIISYIELEKWAEYGGPQPYSDSYTFAVYLDKNQYIQIRSSDGIIKSAQQGDAPEPDSCRLCLMETTSRPGDL